LPTIDLGTLNILLTSRCDVPLFSRQWSPASFPDNYTRLSRSSHDS